ncbi:DUF6084 family protein [Saccharopolyspora taberi]|uniref:DUF6084 family protein n=1 Tax=Saccharopolyspora taberi TaxID=60895 RepID=A0ABN3VIK6_9PSEU
MTAPDLEFTVTGAEPARMAAVPTLHFDLDLRRTGGGPVRSVVLTTAIRIAPARRRYGAAEQDALVELFGLPQRWAQTMRPLPWTRLTTTVGAFTDHVVVPLPVVCTEGVELAVAKYLHAVRDGSVPLEFLFSGTVFHLDAAERLRTAQIDWSREAAFDLEVASWRAAIGDTHWVQMSDSAFARLHDYRRSHALGTLGEAIGSLLTTAEQDVP